MLIRLPAIAAMVLVLIVSGSTYAEDLVIQEGSNVSIEYTLKLDDGTVVDTNVGEAPLVYQQGKGQILPAIEDALTGLKAQDEKAIDLQPTQAYGERDPEAVRSVPLDAIPEEARHSGARLASSDPAGNRVLLTVKEVGDEEVVLDLNHPLAGEALHFEVKVVAVESGAPEGAE